MVDASSSQPDQQTTDRSSPKFQTRASESLPRMLPRFTIRSSRRRVLVREPDWVSQSRTELFRNMPVEFLSKARQVMAQPSASPCRLRASALACRPSVISHQKAQQSQKDLFSVLELLL